MKKLLLSLAVVAGLTTACTQQKAAEKSNRQLVLYYSENGSTKAVAEELQKQLGADIEAIEVVEPYMTPSSWVIPSGLVLMRCL